MLGQVAGKAIKQSARTTKGWRKAAPKLRSERVALYTRCGARAFLQPNEKSPGLSKYPIMAKTGPCVVDCRGLRAAKSRAAQRRHPSLRRRAEATGKRVRCRWAK